MERDPLRLVWRAAPGPTGMLVFLALLAGVPLVLVSLSLIQTAIDAAAGGRENAVTLLRWTLRVPDRISETPVVLLPGITVARRMLPIAMAAGLAGFVLAAAVLWGVSGALAAHIGRRVHDVLIRRISEGIASAPPTASEEARQAAALAVEAIGRDRRGFAYLPALPVLAGAALLASLTWVLICDIESAVALLVALCAFAFVASRQSALRRKLAAAERSVATGLFAALGDLARNLPAVSRHGTQASESDRIADNLAPVEQQADDLEAGVVASSALTGFLLLAGPLAVLSVGLWASRAHELGPGEAASSVVAAAIAVAALMVHQYARRMRADATPVFTELGRILGGFQARRRSQEAPALPVSGRLEASDVATSPAQSGRLAGTDFAFDLPGHVAFTGPRNSGARIAAELLGGQVQLSRGTLALAGEDLTVADPAWLARHIAFAGGETYLFSGTLRSNLVYGSTDSSDLDKRLASAIEAAGLAGLIERRGLYGKVDPRLEPRLAEQLLAARGALRAALETRGLSDLVAPFDPGLYNPHATIGENLLFGAAIGDTFSEDRLATQPFMRSLLDAEDLTKPLTAMGAEIAQTTLEMFSDLPEGPSILAGFSLVSLPEREEIERILGRRSAGRRGTASSRDAERLIAIAMHYCEHRHRLGLLKPDVEECIVRVRTQFAERLPKSLEPAVEIFAADRICAAATVRDNLLFGRIVQGRANAERDIMQEVRVVLDQFGLGGDVARIGLSARLDPVDHGMTMAEFAAVELVRCLVREPDNLVVEHALDHLSHTDAVATVGRLGEAMKGRGLVISLPESVSAATCDRFESVIRFEGGRVVADGTASTPPAAPVRAGHGFGASGGPGNGLRDG